MWYVHDHGDKRHGEYAVMATTAGKNGDGGKVASVWAGRGHHFDWPEAEANARLIAAAPDMLAALLRAEMFLSGFEDDDMQDVTSDLQAIRAAIAKARGTAEGA